MPTARKRYHKDGTRLTDCCGAFSTYFETTLVCRNCYSEVPLGQGDGSEVRDGRVEGRGPVRVAVGTMRTIDHGNLSTSTDNIDQALYVASCLSAASSDKTAHIYGTTDTENETGEAYIVFLGDQEARHHLKPNWSLTYSITHGF